MTTPDTTQTSDPVPPPPEPAVRVGDPIYLGTTPAGECVSGSTQYTFEPCDENGIILEVGTPPVPTSTVAIVEVPVQHTLPVTGGTTIVGGIAALILVSGVACKHLSKRKDYIS